ncbi:MAG: hypothetical protein ABR516_06245, partial [Desulfuromonadaceae bacterium]
GVMYLKDTGDQAFITSTTSPEDAPLADSIPAQSDRTLVNCSDPLSNGWQICVLVPRSALAQHFAQLRKPVLFGAGILIFLSAAATVMLLLRTLRRTHELGEYFRTTMEEER